MQALSRAFRSRFLELHVGDIPDAELANILQERCQLAPSYAAKLVSIMRELQRRRQVSCTAFTHLPLLSMNCQPGFTAPCYCIHADAHALCACFNPVAADCCWLGKGLPCRRLTSASHRAPTGWSSSPW